MNPEKPTIYPKSLFFRLQHQPKTNQIQCKLCGHKSRMLSAAHLNSHGMTSGDYKRIFKVPSVFCDASRFKESKARVRMSAQEILLEIQQRVQAGKGIFYSDIRREQPCLIGRARTHFGPWRKALAAAGIPKAERTKAHAKYVSRDSILNRIQSMFDKGDPLYFSWMERNHFYFLKLATRKFGSWGNALDFLGLRHLSRKPRVHWSREMVVQAVEKRIAEGKEITHAAVLRGDRMLVFAALRLFKNWRSVLKFMGLDITRSGKRLPWSKREVIAAIQTRYRSGAGLWATAVAKGQSGLVAASGSLFGSWDMALKRAGFDPQLIRRARCPWTRESILQEVQERVRAGQKVNYSNMTPNTMFTAAKRIFGSWSNALSAAGLDPRQIHLEACWSREKVLQSIRRLLSKKIDMGWTSIIKISPNLGQAALIYFRTWEEALANARSDPQTQKSVPKPWTKTKLLEYIRRGIDSGKPQREWGARPTTIRDAGKRLFGSWPAALRNAQKGRPMVFCDKKSEHIRENTIPLVEVELFTDEK